MTVAVRPRSNRPSRYAEIGVSIELGAAPGSMATSCSRSAGGRLRPPGGARRLRGGHAVGRSGRALGERELAAMVPAGGRTCGGLPSGERSVCEGLGRQAPPHVVAGRLFGARGGRGDLV